jgi:hypothetical protein
MNLYNRMTYVQDERFHDIDHMASFIRSQLQMVHGYQWILLQIFYLPMEMIQFLWLLIGSQRWPIIPCTKIKTGEETIKLFFDNIYRIHGLPTDIILDRGTQFTSNFWRGLFQLLGVKINLSTAYHPQSDGQTKRVNQILELYLCCTINYQQDDWADLLPLTEFIYNNTLHLLTK